MRKAQKKIELEYYKARRIAFSDCLYVILPKLGYTDDTGIIAELREEYRRALNAERRLEFEIYGNTKGFNENDRRKRYDGNRF